MRERPTILVVEDEPSVADALGMILEDRGYRVFVATSGRDGIEQVRRLRVDLVITDLRLPDASGLDVLAAVRAERPAAAVVLITSHGTQETFARARQLGAAGALHKPFTPDEILDLVVNLIGD